MAKNQSSSAKVKSGSSTPLSAAAMAKAARSAPASRGSWSHSIRETIESIVVAFVLAFLFRTFEAEAFVIPTGSMAPTLQGRHKDVVCPRCGYQYRASASTEVDEEVQRIQDSQQKINATRDELRDQLSATRDSANRRRLEGELRKLEHNDTNNRRRVGEKEVIAVTCPMCRYEMSVDPELPAGQENPAYNGDRILVGKFPYDFGEPRRWDVVVFKYPGDAKVNYIKRLVGLPGESIHIFHGNVHTKGQSDSDFHIQRKPPDKLRAMMQLVYDNDYIPDALTSAGWPVRWQSWAAPSGKGDGTWKSDDGSRSYDTEGKSDEPVWLRYQHFTPTRQDWQAIDAGQAGKELNPRATLITDFYAYNAGLLRKQSHSPEAQAALGMHWVGDLMLECEAEVKSESGELWLDLVEGGMHFRAIIDVATSEARLEIDGLANFRPTASTPLKGPGTYQLAFSNADDELLLWVNGKVMQFDGPTVYSGLNNDRPRATGQDPGDLAPAGIASKGAALRVNHMKLWRDIYYIATDLSEQSGVISDYPFNVIRRNGLGDALADLFTDSRKWEGPGNLFDERQETKFSLEADQFFMLGDNSPASKDSRLWEGGTFVHRELLIGKALFIYWPHAWPAKYYVPIRVFGTEVRVPFWPNFRRMGFVR